MISSYNFENNIRVNTIKVISQKFNKFIISPDKYWGANAISTNPFIFYDPKEWQNLKIENDSKIETINRGLAPNTTLEIQYVSNSGKRLYSSNNGSDYENNFKKK